MNKVYILYRISNEYTSHDFLDREDSEWNIEGIYSDEKLAEKNCNLLIQKLKDEYEDEDDFQENSCIDYLVVGKELITEQQKKRD